MTDDFKPHVTPHGVDSLSEKDASPSLRDWFAAAALAGIATPDTDATLARRIATDAYEYADAMLEVRKNMRVT